MDEKTLAIINLRAILGSIPRLCELDSEAAALIAGKHVSIGFSIKDVDAATLSFEDGVCTFTDGADHAMVKLPFSSAKKFNGLIEGTVTPIPTSGFTKIGFLLKEFTKLTDLLTHYLRPEEKDLRDPAFFNTSTTLMFHLIVEALAAIGNYDKVGKFSASYITDGRVKLSVAGGPAAYIRAQGGSLLAVHEAPASFTSYMEFGDMHIARDLFDGKINAVASVGLGKVRVGGMMSQVDNVNRILDRVALYLA